MPDSLDPLILDLLEWIASEPRTYADVMESWRTSCPRLPVWEDASERGLVVRERDHARGAVVSLTPAGREFLDRHRRVPPAVEPPALEPFGESLLAYHRGRADAVLVIRIEDGREFPLPVSQFFREPSQFTAIETAALGACRGRVLDAGAGAGIHSVVVQERGLPVTAIDVSPHAVRILRERGVHDVHCADIFAFQGGTYDTILMLGHGIGMVRPLTGLDRFLAHLPALLVPGGQLLLSSMDVLATDDPAHLAYHEANRRAGRDPGEIRMQFRFDGHTGPPCEWLHVAHDRLARHAAAAGLQCRIMCREGPGDYLAAVTVADAARPPRTRSG